MASHGKKRHQKRLARPRALPISPKKHVYLKKASAGPHPKDQSLPILTYLVEIAKLAGNSREARALLRSDAVLVDGRPVKDAGFPVGFMDIITIPKASKCVRVSIFHGRLAFNDAPMEAAGSKLCKIISKRQLGKSRFQLNMHDGRNIMVQESAKYATGGTLRISVPKQEVAEYYPLKAGARCLVYKGVHSGKVATLSELIEREASAATDAMLKTGDGSQFITRKDYLFVVGPEFS